MNSAERLRLYGKLRFIIPSFIAIAAFSVSLFLFFLPRVREIGIEQKKDSIRELVRLPIQICSWMQERADLGEISESKARRQAASIIRDLRYGDENKDYFWITDMTPVLIAHPYRSDLENTDVSDYQDLDGVPVFMDMVRIIQNEGEGFVTYHWQVRDEADMIERKISYVASYEPWGWIIGTGMYWGEVEMEMDLLTRSMIYVSIGVALFVSLLLFFMIRTGLSEYSAKIRARAELAESRDQYKELITMMHEGIIVRDTDGLVSYVNRQFCDMLGYSEEELIGKPLIEFIAGGSVESFRKEMEKRKTGTDQVYQTEWKRRDGGIISTLMSPRVLYGPDGKTKGSFAVVSDITELKTAEKELRSLLQEKTTLLKEIHHRVKNNLQLITSLFSLQYQYVEDEQVRSVLFDSQSRIQTMTRVHEFLYQSNSLKDVEMKEFLDQLVIDIQSLYIDTETPDISFTVQVDPVKLSVDRAIPCGLIMNELLSNAAKHAFTANAAVSRERVIRLFLHEDSDCIRFGVEDNGRGLPEKTEIEAEASLGMELVAILTEQLKGRIEFGAGVDGKGVRAEICMPFKRDEISVLSAV